MICPKCKGKKGYLIGPVVATDWRRCSECGGTGTTKPPVVPSFDLGVARKMQYPLMKDMLEDIDKTIHRARVERLSVVVEAMLNGVPIIVNNHVKDGQFAIMVSPLDFERLKEEYGHRANYHGNHSAEGHQEPVEQGAGDAPRPGT